MLKKAPKFSIILAAGKGTRMGVASKNKVCFPVDGIPAINRALEIYNRCHLKQHIIVVGALAGQVLETVGKQFSNVTFVYQPEQLGTAHAVKIGMNSLELLSSEDEVLIVAGDRIIELSALEQLFDLFYTQKCDLAILTTPGKKGSNQGRIVVDDSGDVMGIVEMADIRQRQIYRKLRKQAETKRLPSKEKIIEYIKRTFFKGKTPSNETKLEKAFGNLWKILSDKKHKLTSTEILNIIPEELTEFRFIRKNGTLLKKSPSAIESSTILNTSVYLVKISALQYALKKLNRKNAQQEEYLSDLAMILSQTHKNKKPCYRIRLHKVSNPDYVLGFNDPAELLEVEDYIKTQKSKTTIKELPSGPYYRSVKEWRKTYHELQKKCKSNKTLWSEMVTLYSNDKQIIQDHIKRYMEVLDYAAKIIGNNTKIFIIRSPGRVNVMGRHVDHQGGNCNLMTIGYEALMIVHPRKDDRVCLYNLDKKRFGNREFSIGDLVSDLPWDDWLSLVNSEKLSEMISNYGVDWSQYIKAAVLRLQKKFSHTKLLGMDIVVSGDIPMGAGLSSSSSLVVGAAEAVVTVNQLDTFPSQLVTLCGEGEWFVGTRGGSADHAAVKLGQKGKVVKVTFFDFAVQDIVPFPDDYVMALCDSGIKAVKSANAKDQFNHRISCYRIGFKLIRKFFPQYAPLLHHLRDVNIKNLGIPLSWIYRILLHLPEQSTREELQEMLPDEDIDQYFSMHKPPEDGLYPIRGVVLFGLAECERSRHYADCLKNNDIQEIGRLMNVSHNGDRVAKFTEDGVEIPYQAPISNSYILNLMEDLESGDPERVIHAQLQWQPGSYHCSIPAIDKMVDTVLRLDGVVGAQLAGAGLGGCMMVLAHKNTVKNLINTLTKNYYKPAKVLPSILICKPVAGSGVLMLDR